MKKLLIAGSILVGLFLIVTFWCIGVNNSVLKQEEQIAEAKSSITIVLKKRADSIRQMTQVIENFNAHEQGIIDSVTEARKQLDSGDVAGAAITIKAVLEAYPDIKSASNYNILMNEIAINENKILQHREYYNLQVKEYKNKVKVFPNTLFLSIGGYEKITFEYFDLEDDFDVTNIFGN